MKISISVGKRFSIKALTKDDLEELFNFDELDEKDQKFWFKFLKEDPDTCSVVARYLERISELNDASPNEHQGNITLDSDSIHRLAAYAGIGSYTKVYRGFGIADPEKYKIGGSFNLDLKRDSHWSQIKSEAAAVASGISRGLVVEMNFNKSDVVVDLNVVPWACGPVGREPELILSPIKRKVKIVSVYL